MSHRHWCTSCARHHEFACNAAECDKPVNAPCARALREAILLARKKLVATVAVMSMLAGGCGGAAKHKPVHVPQVRYQATLNDKDCKPTPGKPGEFDCNNVHLNPIEIDAKGQK